MAQLKFGEWTDDGVLRQPVYLGMRDDVEPRRVHREPDPTLHGKSLRGASWRGDRPSSIDDGQSTVDDHDRRRRCNRRSISSTPSRTGTGSGVLHLSGDLQLEVSNLRKVFWPKLKITKGELMRYYARVAPFLLPVVKDRPLIMKRFPNGVDGKAFYQQRAPEPVPRGVRVATLPDDKEVPSRLIGGDLITLLYMTQLAVVSQDPWFSRVQSPPSRITRPSISIRCQE